MFSPKSYKQRREALRKAMSGSSGIVLLPGNELSPFNYPNNTYHFRQDSTFRYFFGANIPSLVGVIDLDSGVDTLFGSDFTVEDIIWTGVQPTISERAAEAGVESTNPLKDLQSVVDKAIEQGRTIHFLPPYRGETTLQLCELLGIKPKAIHNYKSLDLLFAVAELREVKSEEEIAALEDAFQIGYAMHTKAMQMCRRGVSEREIYGTIEGIALSMGAGTSFSSITSQHGETLHNISQDGVLEDGRLFLCDAGGESLWGYCSDHTRTYPVSGKFSDVQRDLYNIALKAHQSVIATARPMPYMELFRAAQRVLAEGLRDIGLMKGSLEDIMEAGAVSLFMPHGLSHGMGMDVHDLENIGERSFDFSAISERAAQSATCLHRTTWQLRAGSVISNEPGIYFIPALIEAKRREGAYSEFVNYDKVVDFYNFGGIRIEDDLLITDGGNRVIGDKKIPVTVEEIEAAMSH